MYTKFQYIIYSYVPSAHPVSFQASIHPPIPSTEAPTRRPNHLAAPPPDRPLPRDSQWRPTSNVCVFAREAHLSLAHRDVCLSSLSVTPPLGEVISPVGFPPQDVNTGDRRNTSLLPPGATPLTSHGVVFLLSALSSTSYFHGASVSRFCFFFNGASQLCKVYECL